MTLRYLALARHGQSQANRKLQKSSCGLYYSLCGSDKEVPLTDAGFRQADRLGERLKKLFPSFRPLAQIHENGFRRVQQTVDRVVGKIPYPLPRMTQIALEKRHYGDFWNLTRKGVKKLHPEEWKRYLEEGDLHYRAPGGGENYQDVFDRVDGFVNKFVLPADHNQLVVTSSVIALAFQRRFEGLSATEVMRKYEAMAVANAELRIYQSEPGGAWQICDIDSLIQ